VLLGGDVGHKRDDFAGDVLAMGFDDGLKLLFCTADNVDFGAVDGESLDTHETNARACSLSMMSEVCVADADVLTSTSDEGNFALDIKDVAQLKVRIVRLHLAS